MIDMSIPMTLVNLLSLCRPTFHLPNINHAGPLDQAQSSTAAMVGLEQWFGPLVSGMTPDTQQGSWISPFWQREQVPPRALAASITQSRRGQADQGGETSSNLRGLTGAVDGDIRPSLRAAQPTHGQSTQSRNTCVSFS